MGDKVAPFASLGSIADRQIVRRSMKPKMALLTAVSIVPLADRIKRFYDGCAKNVRRLTVVERRRYALPMRKTEVPQFGQTPFTAGLPFLSVTFWGSLISMFALHFTQYACGISRSTEAAFCPVLV